MSHQGGNLVDGNVVIWISLMVQCIYLKHAVHIASRTPGACGHDAKQKRRQINGFGVQIEYGIP
jgi:hypothetical protein